MQVEVDVKCMQTNFGGCGLSGFGVMAPFCLPSKTAKISLRTMGYNSLWGSKNRIGSKNSCKYGLIWNACKPILVGVASLVSEILLIFHLPLKQPKFPFGPWAIVHGGHSNRLNFLMTMDYSPWSEWEIWPFLKVTISPKLKRSRPPKLVCMRLTWVYTCMNFLSRFQSIKFFNDHGL